MRGVSFALVKMIRCKNIAKVYFRNGNIIVSYYNFDRKFLTVRVKLSQCDDVCSLK